MRNPALRSSVTLENVTVSYSRHPAVHHVSGCFSPGSLTALTGPNGAGKSTLLKAIAGILPAEGRILLEGTTRDRIAYLPQVTSYERDFPLDVLSLVCTGAWREVTGFSAITREIQDRAALALEEVGMAHAARRNLGSLSAGQFQRVLFARLMLQDASLILLDEPFNALDASTTAHLLEVVQRWHAQGRTILCVLHDPTHIRNYFPQCLVLARECIAWGKTEAVLGVGHIADNRFLAEPVASETPEICAQAL